MNSRKSNKNPNFIVFATLMLIALFVSACSQSTPLTSPVIPNSSTPAPIVPTPEVRPPIVPTPVIPGAPEEKPVSPPIVTEPAPTKSESITAAELASHNTRSDCWVGFQGNAYDVTAWLPRHPGGVSSIARYCGTANEFAQAFANKHGSGKVNLLKKEGTLMGALA